MVAERQNIPLRNVCEINPDKRDSSWHHTVIKYIDITSVGTGVLNDNPGTIPLSEAPSRAQRLVRAGDTIVSTVRPNRRSFLYLRDPSPNTVASTGFAVLRAKRECDPRFLYYVVANQAFTDYLSARADGSAYPAVNASVFGDAEVSIPPLPEQRIISHILGTLDDKIDLNRRMNETLEAMAQAILKSWFVDFDPVRAKAVGKKPVGMDKETAALFPDSIVESELGEIPKGWRVGRLGEIISIESGKRPSGRSEFRTPEYLVQLIGASGVMGFVKEGIYFNPIIVIGRVGTHGIVQRISGPSFPSDNTLVIRPNFYEYVYQVMRSVDYKSLNVGSTQPLITQSAINSYQILIPDSRVLSKFEEFVSPFFRKVQSNIEENRILSQVRDTLLPKLMSGEVKIKNVEKLAEQIL